MCGEHRASDFRTGISWRIIAEDGFELFEKTSITAPPPSVDAHDPAEKWDASTRRAFGSTLRRTGLPSAPASPISRKTVRRPRGRRPKERRFRLDASRRRVVRGDGRCGSSRSYEEQRRAAWRRGSGRRREGSTASLEFRRSLRKLLCAPRLLSCRKLQEAAFVRSSRWASGAEHRPAGNPASLVR